MIGRRAIIGLSLLCTLVLCAFAAPNAMAEKGTTAYTCKKVEMAAAFEDAHCTKDAEGGKGYIHEELPPEAFEVTAANSVTGKLEPSKFKTVIAGIEVELEAGSFHTCEGGTTVINKEKLEKMFAGGLYCGEFTKVVVNKPANCSVPGNAVKLNEGAYATGVTKGEMFIEFAGVENKPIAEFELTGLKCVVKTTVKVTGIADANVMKEEFPLNGATLKFTTKDTEVALKVGAQKAKFEGTFTPYSPNTERPFVLTTTEH